MHITSASHGNEDAIPFIRCDAQGQNNQFVRLERELNQGFARLFSCFTSRSIACVLR
jgi:hypothetical protein